MKKTLFLSCIFTLFILASSCKSDEHNIYNNYIVEKENMNAPNRKMMIEYGDKDGNSVLKFSYYKNQIGKLQELTSYNAGVANSKMVVLFNNNGNPIGYQNYKLPANILTSQGTYILDNINRITQVVNLSFISDTISIFNFNYDGLDYQPSSFNFYDKSQDKIIRYSYFDYDYKGNLYNQTDYQFNGSTLYKSVNFTSDFSNAINPLNQLYYYIITILPNTTSSKFYSNYFGRSSREEKFKPSGLNDGVFISNYSIETDSNNYVTKFTLDGQEVIIKYK